MKKIDKYEIRQLILKRLKEGGDKSHSIGDVLAAERKPISISVEELVEEWENLRMFGYITRCLVLDGKEYCSITMRGLKQLHVEFEKDVFIYGPGAISCVLEEEPPAPTIEAISLKAKIDKALGYLREVNKELMGYNNISKGIQRAINELREVLG